MDGRTRHPVAGDRQSPWTRHGLDPQQTGAFLDFIADERLYPLFHLVALRGLRRAEVAGLPWSETDLNAGTITIRETRPDGGLYIDDPKSESGERTVSLDAATTEILKAWGKQQATERLAAGRLWHDSGLVFTWQDGAPYRPEYLSQRFDVLIERHATIRRRYAEGRSIAQLARRHRVSEDTVRIALTAPLPPIHFHGLRHGSATLSLAAGVDMKIVSATLGHSQASFTADTYVSVIPEVATAAAEAVAAVVPRRCGPTMAPQEDTSGLSDDHGLGETAGQGRRLGDLNPGWAVNPNRISSAAP
jgi:integrase